MNLKKYVVALMACFFLFGKSAMMQSRYSTPFGGSIGLVAAIGTKIDRMGFCLKGYYTKGTLQLNADLRFYGNIKNLGPSGFYPEGFASLGIVYGYGNQDSLNKTYFLTSVSNQTGYSNSFGYSYNVYFNQIGTSQQTGTLSFQFHKTNFISENDIFGHSFFDRFRTGAMLVQYTYNRQWQFALNCTMWTGQLEHKIKDGDPHFPNGYMDTTHSIYSEHSHGLLSLQASTILSGYDQPAQLNAGIDAEQVRNAVQNHLIHDLLFLPKKWRSSRNVDMPMIDEKGDQFLYKTGQKIKKPELYVNGYLNPLLFY
jgi:hypothetical protein